MGYIAKRWNGTIGLATIGPAILAVTSSTWLVGRHAGSLVPREPLITWTGPATGEGARSAADVAFPLDNPGGKAVRILSAESGCGCASPIIDQQIIPPGGSATSAYRP